MLTQKQETTQRMRDNIDLTRLKIKAKVKILPMNNLKEAGMDLFSFAQKTPDFFK